MKFELLTGRRVKIDAVYLDNKEGILPNSLEELT